MDYVHVYFHGHSYGRLSWAHINTIGHPLMHAMMACNKTYVPTDLPVESPSTHVTSTPPIPPADVHHLAGLLLTSCASLFLQRIIQLRGGIWIMCTWGGISIYVHVHFHGHSWHRPRAPTYPFGHPRLSSGPRCTWPRLGPLRPVADLLQAARSTSCNWAGASAPVAWAILLILSNWPCPSRSCRQCSMRGNAAGTLGN